MVEDFGCQHRGACGLRFHVVDCTGGGKLSKTLLEQANKLNPKAETVSMMALSMDKVNVPEVKRMLNHLTPDTLVVIPPAKPSGPAFMSVLREAVRQTEMVSGRIVLVSSYEAIGDASNRSEATIPFASDEYGDALYAAEVLVQTNTGRGYIMRFPHFTDSPFVKEAVDIATKVTFIDGLKDVEFTLCDNEDVARLILAQVQTGWFGLYHVTPNDRLLLSKVSGHDTGDKRVPDHSLSSKYTWKMKSSQELWKRAINS